MALHKLHMISFRANIHSGYFIIMTEDSPQQKAQEISNLGDCPICLQPMLVEEGGLAHLPCGHGFHASCASLLATSGIEVCPVCRNPFGAAAGRTEKRAKEEEEESYYDNGHGEDERRRFVARTVPVSALRRGSIVILKGRPCRLVDISTCL